MIFGMANLYSNTQDKIAKIRNIKTSGVVNTTEIACVSNRAVQLCALDAILFEHRKKYGTQLNPLTGIHALHHKLLLKYHWPLSLIRELSLFDSLLALQDELNFELLPEGAGNFLSGIADSNYPANFPDHLSDEWDPNLSSKYLTEHQR